MKDKTLGDIVEEALEEYKPTQRRFNKLKTSLEHVMQKHRKAVVWGSGLIGAGVNYYIFSKAGKITFDYIQMRPNIPHDFMYKHFYEMLVASGTALGYIIGYVTSALLTPAHIGKRFNSQINLAKEKNAKRIGKIFRYPKTLAAGITALLNYKEILNIPDIIKKINIASVAATTDIAAKKQYASYVTTAIGTAYSVLGIFASLSILFFIFRDFEIVGKEKLKNGIDQFLTQQKANIIGMTSKDKKLKFLKISAEKKATWERKMLLGSALLRKDIYEGLNYSKDLIDEIKKPKKESEFILLKNFNRGNSVIELYSKKDDWIKFFSLLANLQKGNSEVAKYITEKVRDRKMSKQIDVSFLLNYFSQEILKIGEESHWAELAKDIIDLSMKHSNIQEFQSSEGKVWTYTGSKLINRSLVLKEYQFDFFERFLKQKFEYEALRGSEIKTENPLAFIKEGKISRVLSTREGDMILAEFLKNKDRSYKRIVLERAIEDCMLTQKILYEKTRKENGNTYLEVMFGNKSYSLKMDELDLIKQLYNRAFIGDERRGLRWGENDHLAELMGMIIDYTSEKYNTLFFGIGHGDFSSDNIVINTKDEDLKKAKTSENFKGKLSRIDPRHVVITTTYDPTHLSFSSGFNEFEKDEIGNDIFNGLCKIYNFTNLGSFQNNFNCLYLLTGLGISAAYQARGEIDNGAIALNKILEFSKDKPFGDKLWLYLKDSRAQPLLKII